MDDYEAPRGGTGLSPDAACGGSIRVKRWRQIVREEHR